MTAPLEAAIRPLGSMVPLASSDATRKLPMRFSRSFSGRPRSQQLRPGRFRNAVLLVKRGGPQGWRQGDVAAFVFETASSSAPVSGHPGPGGCVRTRAGIRDPWERYPPDLKVSRFQRSALPLARWGWIAFERDRAVVRLWAVGRRRRLFRRFGGVLIGGCSGVLLLSLSSGCGGGGGEAGGPGRPGGGLQTGQGARPAKRAHRYRGLALQGGQGSGRLFDDQVGPMPATWLSTHNSGDEASQMAGHPHLGLPGSPSAIWPARLALCALNLRRNSDGYGRIPHENASAGPVPPGPERGHVNAQAGKRSCSCGLSSLLGFIVPDENKRPAGG
jgi:hypothetical protein